MNLNVLYQTNRSRFIANLKSKVTTFQKSIVIFKGSYLFHNYDTSNTYAPKYDQNFIYLFGIHEFGFDGFIDLANSNSYLIKSSESLNGFVSGFAENEPKSEYQLKLSQDSRQTEITKQEAQDRFGVTGIFTQVEFLEFLEKYKPERVYLNYGIDRYTGVKSNSYDEPQVLDQFKDIIDRDTTYPILNNTRTIKSKEEISFMRQICEISSRGHVEIMRHCKPGMYEYQIAALFYVRSLGILDTRRST